MTEPATPQQIRHGIAQKLSAMPANVDHDGHTDLDRARDAATIDRTAELAAEAATVLDAIRAQARKSL